jgi:low affinity Fe/Cu permease
MPSQVTPHVSWFDRFAGAVSTVTGRAWFFAACTALVIGWVPSYWLFRNVDTWQLVINTATTIVTFLLVALLQNSTSRADQADQHKQNAIAAGLAALMDAFVDDLADSDFPGDTTGRLRDAARELRTAVGLEERESS